MFLQAAIANNFWEFNIGHVIDAGLVVFAGAGYVLSRKSDIRVAQEKRAESEAVQIKMHTENRERLDVLADFHATQLELNNRRDEQISLLRENTAALKHMVEGQDRRLQLLEDRNLRS